MKNLQARLVKDALLLVVMELSAEDCKSFTELFTSRRAYYNSKSEVLKLDKAVEDFLKQRNLNVIINDWNIQTKVR